MVHNAKRPRFPRGDHHALSLPSWGCTQKRSLRAPSVRMR